MTGDAIGIVQLLRARQEQFGETLNGHQRVVEIVRYSPGQLPDGFHFLCLTILFLKQ